VDLVFDGTESKASWRRKACRADPPPARKTRSRSCWNRARRHFPVVGVRRFAAHSTSVSSSRPRCLRSPSNAATVGRCRGRGFSWMRWCLLWVSRVGRCHSRPGRSARPFAQPAGEQAAVGEVALAYMSRIACARGNIKRVRRGKLHAVSRLQRAYPRIEGRVRVVLRVDAPGSSLHQIELSALLRCRHRILRRNGIIFPGSRFEWLMYVP